MFINGKEMDLPDGITVTKLFEELGLNKDRVVVEINMKIVSKEQYRTTKINMGDKVEIVRFVGGG